MLASSSPFFTAASLGGQLANATFTSSFVNMFGDADITAVVAGNTLSSSSVLHTYPPAATLTLLLKTLTVFREDKVVTIKYMVQDAAMRLHCDPTGASVVATVGAIIASCTLFTPSSPSGTCSVTMPSPLFSASPATLPASVPARGGDAQGGAEHERAPHHALPEAAGRPV
jgi:hypothetical protein